MNYKIIEQLEKLKISYYGKKDKKWQINALNKAIQPLKKYDKIISSGTQVQNEIKGIGKKIALHIDDILKNGFIEELSNQNIQQKSYEDFMAIVGVGQAKAKEWISKDIKTIEQLKKAIAENKISLTHNIELGLKYYDDLKIRIPRIEIDKLKKKVSQILKKINKEILFEICGSYRRNNQDSGDIDFLISHPKYKDQNQDYNYLKEILKELKKEKIIIDEMTKNPTKKFLGMCKIPDYPIICRIDLMYIDYESYYSSIMYFTGNKYFNVYLRNKCLEKNYSLNEYCLTHLESNEKIFLKNESHIFEILEISYLEPEQRNFLNNKK